MSEHTPASRSTSGYAKKIESLIEQRDSLRAVNAELLEALEGLMQLEEEDHQRGHGDEDVCIEVRKARAAIASARKQGEQG